MTASEVYTEKGYQRYILKSSGLCLDEFWKSTPAEIEVCEGLQDEKTHEQLKWIDLMIARASWYNISAHGGKIELKDLLVMIHDVVDGGAEYNYGPGQTLVSEEPETEQEKIEQIAHLSEMKRRMRMFGGLTNG